MAQNVELRRSNGTNFTELIYVKSHWSNIDGKPTNFVPTAHGHNASDITQNSTHRFVTDTEKSTWNAKADHDHTHIISNVDGLQTALNSKLGTDETAYNSTRWNGYRIRVGSYSSGLSNYITFGI